MKKLVKSTLAVILAATMAFSLSACGEKTGGSANKSSSKTSGTSTEKSVKSSSTTSSNTAEGGKGKIAYVVGGLGDKSFSDSGEEGMKQLRAKGWDCKTIEVGDETKADKWEDYMMDTIDEGYQYIVASSTFRDIMLKLAKENPEVKFVLFDELMDESELPDNMALIFYAQNEGSYMVGQMAAGMSKSKVVAVNVGMDNPVIADFVTGFINGIKDYDPSVKVIKAAVGSWTEPAKMKELCLTQARDQKADVFYQVAGGSGGGLFEACKETGNIAIGVDSDQYQYYKDSENPELADVIYTSMLKNVGDSFVAFFDRVEKGEGVWKKVNILGLKDNAVGYVDNDYFKKMVPEEVRNKMAESQQKIVSGEIKVQSYYDFKDEAEYQALLDSMAP